MAGIVRLLKSRPEPFPGDGRTGGTVEAGLRTGGRSGSGGPEPETYLKRSAREEPASSGSPSGVPRGVGAGGEISRTAMVSRDCGRPRSCARGAENGVGHAVVTTTMPPVQPSRWIGRGLRGRTAAPTDRSSRARTATLPPLPVVRRTTTGQGSWCGTKGGKVSAMSMIAIRLPASCAALLLIAAALAQARLVRAPTLMSTRE